MHKVHKLTVIENQVIVAKKLPVFGFGLVSSLVIETRAVNWYWDFDIDFGKRLFFDIDITENMSYQYLIFSSKYHNLIYDFNIWYFL